MSTEVATINPQEFGLEAGQAVKVEQAFTPMLIERDAMVKVYENIINSALTPALTKEAREARLRLQKVRTGIEKAHKAEKAFYLTGGRFVDALKNKYVTSISQMEETLEGIELHYVKLEAERKEKVKAERIEALKPFEVDTTFIDLLNMNDEQFESLRSNSELAYNAKKEAERIAEEARKAEEEKVRLRTERRTLLLESGLISFYDTELNLGQLSIEEWEKVLLGAKESKESHEKEQARVKAENERLQKEKEAAEAKAKAIQAEAERKAKEEADKAKKAIEEANRLKAEAEAKLAAEQKAKAEAEAKAKAEAEEAERKRIAEEKKAAKAPVKTKLKNWVNSIEAPELVLNPDDLNATNTHKLILEKFNAFKAWAVAQVENI